eukprot:5734425-Pyramimonas_sp.AAC.1
MATATQGGERDPPGSAPDASTIAAGHRSARPPGGRDLSWCVRSAPIELHQQTQTQNRPGTRNPRGEF